VRSLVALFAVSLTLSAGACSDGGGSSAPLATDDDSGTSIDRTRGDRDAETSTTGDADAAATTDAQANDDAGPTGDEGDKTVGLFKMSLPLRLERKEAFIGKSYYGDCEGFGGKLAEIVMYARALSEDELTAAGALLSARWGLTY